MLDQTIEDNLILDDCKNQMLNYVSLQVDIDEDKIKAASNICQTLDVKRLIGITNLERCISPSTDEDIALKALVVPPLCFYTYSRLLRLFQSAFTESGLEIEKEALQINETKRIANEARDVAESYMQEVLDYLEEENSSANDEQDLKEKLVQTVRVFGGEERFASN